MIAASRPGKRVFTSVHREWFRISTPCRTLRINPASRSTLKWFDNDDFGMTRSPNVATQDMTLSPSMPPKSKGSDRVNLQPRSLTARGAFRLRFNPERTSDALMLAAVTRPSYDLNAGPNIDTRQRSHGGTS